MPDAYPLTEADPAKLGFAAKPLQHLDRLIRQHIEEGRYPGAQIALARHGQLALFRSYGDAKTEPRKEPATGETLFLLFSQTKVLTSSAVWALIEEGRLSFMDKIADHLPEFAARGKGDITLQQVMTHQGGFPSGDVTQASWTDHALMRAHRLLPQPVLLTDDRVDGRQRAADDRRHLFEELIAARHHDARMQQLVGGLIAGFVRPDSAEGVVGIANPCDVRRTAPRRRLSTRARLDQNAEFDHVAQEQRIGLRTKAPVHDILIDHPPVAHRPDARAYLRPHIEHIAREQHRQRFAHHRSTDVEILGQHILRWQHSAIFFFDDARDEPVHDLADQRTILVSLFHDTLPEAGDPPRVAC